MPPPGPVKIGHKKDGRRRQLHRFHVSRPPPLTRPLDPLLMHLNMCLAMYLGMCLGVEYVSGDASEYVFGYPSEYISGHIS